MSTSTRNFPNRLGKNTNVYLGSRRAGRHLLEAGPHPHRGRVPRGHGHHQQGRGQRLPLHELRPDRGVRERQGCQGPLQQQQRARLLAHRGRQCAHRRPVLRSGLGTERPAAQRHAGARRPERARLRLPGTHRHRRAPAAPAGRAGPGTDRHHAGQLGRRLPGPGLRAAIGRERSGPDGRAVGTTHPLQQRHAGRGLQRQPGAVVATAARARSHGLRVAARDPLRPHRPHPEPGRRRAAELSHPRSFRRTRTGPTTAPPRATAACC
jgi:hypothetical protein